MKSRNASLIAVTSHREYKSPGRSTSTPTTVVKNSTLYIRILLYSKSYCANQAHQKKSLNTISLFIKRRNNIPEENKMPTRQFVDIGDVHHAGGSASEEEDNLQTKLQHRERLQKKSRGG